MDSATAMPPATESVAQEARRQADMFMEDKGYSVAPHNVLEIVGAYAWYFYYAVESDVEVELEVWLEDGEWGFFVRGTY